MPVPFNQSGASDFQTYQTALKAISNELWEQYKKTKDSDIEKLYKAYCDAFWEGETDHVNSIYG